MAPSTSNNFSSAFYYQLLLIALGVFTVRVSVSLWGYSGEGKPPMYGDFEAQRHWMEITTNLPPNEWYINTPYNDLLYWGLDYPPLTAYHMLLNGKVAEHFNPKMVAVKTSQGIEGPDVKLFMRLSVLAMDLLIFLPATVAFFMLARERNEDEKDILVYIMVTLGYPGLLLIDNGHFQYNNVSLGLLILATLALSHSYDLFGAFLFCLALNYKQMELYHALPFFGYLLGSCIRLTVSKGLYKLAMLSLVVVITFIAIWGPFLHSFDSALAVVQRIFPINRGLFEDKVANFWCAISVIIKFKAIFSSSTMAFICLVVTGILLLPSFLHLLYHPTVGNFHYAIVNSSLIFFLFSFHVHEKSILLAAVPLCLLIKREPLPGVWFLLISVFSMLPLLLKDGLLIPAIATVSLYWLVVNHYLKPGKDQQREVLWVFQISILGAVCLALATIFIPPPMQYPDLFPVLISMYSCGHFILFALYFHMKQMESAKFIDIFNTEYRTKAGQVSSRSSSAERDENSKSTFTTQGHTASTSVFSEKYVFSDDNDSNAGVRTRSRASRSGKQ